MIKIKKEYNVYVIGLEPEFAKTKKAEKNNPDFKPGPNKRCYYVGSTYLTPEERYKQHLTKHVNKKGHPIYSRTVFNFGYKINGLRPKQYQKYNPIATRSEAEKIEEALADKLRKKGHCVHQK